MELEQAPKIAPQDDKKNEHESDTVVDYLRNIEADPYHYVRLKPENQPFTAEVMARIDEHRRLTNEKLENERREANAQFQERLRILRTKTVEELEQIYNELFFQRAEKALLAGRTFDEINLMNFIGSMDEQLVFDAVQGKLSYFPADNFSKQMDSAIARLKEKYPEEFSVKEDVFPSGSNLSSDLRVGQSGEAVSMEGVESSSAETNEFIRDRIIENDLSYQDASISEEAKKEHIRLNKESDNAPKYADAISELSNRTNLAEVRGLAKGLQEKMLDECGKLGINVSVYGYSTSWAMWDIGKQYYYFTHKDKADQKYSIEDPLLSLQKQQEIVDRHLGWEAYSAYNNDEDFKIKIQDGKFAKAREILSRPLNSHNALSSFDLALLGKALREAA